MDIDPDYDPVEAARPPRNLVLLAFPIGAAGLLAFTTHIALVSWAFGLSLIAWCAVMLVWHLQHDDR